MTRKPIIATGVWISDGYHGASMEPVDIVGFHICGVTGEELVEVRRGPSHFLWLEKSCVWGIKHLMQVPKRIRRNKMEGVNQ